MFYIISKKREAPVEQLKETIQESSYGVQLLGRIGASYVVKELFFLTEVVTTHTPA